MIFGMYATTGLFTVFFVALLLAFYLLYRHMVSTAEAKFSVLVAISKIFRRDIPLRKIFPDIIQVVAKTITPVDSGAVIIFGQKSEYKMQAYAGITEKEFDQVKIPKKHIESIKKRKCGVAWRASVFIKDQIHNATLCPLQVQNTVVGAFVLFHKKKHLKTSDLLFLNTLLNHISLEFEDRLLQTKLDAFSKGLSMVEYSYEKIVDNLPTGIVVVDPEGLVLLWNKTMSEMTKKDGHEVIGSSYKDVFGQTGMIKFYEELRRTNLLSQIDEHKHGEMTWSIVGYPLFDKQNQVIAYVMMHRDITAEKNLQRKLRQTQDTVNRELQDKINIATKELKDANTDLIRLNLIKSEFVSTISHELKTPLTSIKGYISLLLSEKLGSVSNKQKDALSIVNHQSDRLNALINDVLDLSRLESGKTTLKIEQVDPARVMESAVEVIIPQAAERKLTIKKQYKEGTKMFADKMKLHQMILNLLSNAVKFTPPKGIITLTLNNHKDLCIIEVTDTGIGIDKEQLDKLFEPFYQVEDHMTRNVSGTGLGLTIVKRIVELHRGTISVSSVKDKGTTFTLTLPKRQ